MGQARVQGLELAVDMLGEVDDVRHELIGVVVVITVLGGVQAVLTHLLIALEIGLEALVELA